LGRIDRVQVVQRLDELGGAEQGQADRLAAVPVRQVEQPDALRWHGSQRRQTHQNGHVKAGEEEQKP
jgi:hypothetical protein